MKKRMSAIVLLLFCLAGCASMGEGIKPDDIAGQPTVYARVLKEPDPLLMGAWQTIFSRHIDETGENDSNTIQYYLGKYGDRYAVYFFRTTRHGQKRYVGWRDFTIYGNEITSDTGMSFFAKDGNVYFQYQGSAPLQMTRMQGLASQQ